MNTSRRLGLTWGIILILAGLVFLAAQIFPAVFAWADGFTWPWFVIGAGALLLIIGILTNTAGLVVPACIVAGIGGILYWQNSSGQWESWAWIWAAIPGFAGVGTIIMGLWERKPGVALGGVGTVLVSLVLTIIFATFLGGPRLLGDYWRYWPILLIVLGLISLVQYFIRPRTATANE